MCWGIVIPDNFWRRFDMQHIGPRQYRWIFSSNVMMCTMTLVAWKSCVLFLRYAGILSAYGIALADVVHEAQEACSKIYCQGVLRKTIFLTSFATNCVPSLAFLASRVCLACSRASCRNSVFFIICENLCFRFVRVFRPKDWRTERNLWKGTSGTRFWRVWKARCLDFI